MANDIEIRVTGTDVSGPAMTSATRHAQSLRDTVTRAGTSMRATSVHARRLSDDLDRLAGSAALAGRGMATLDGELLTASRGAASLDRQVEELRQSLDDLARSDTKLTLIDADRERAELAKATNAATLLPGVNAQAGQIGTALGRGIGDAAGPAAATGLMSKLAIAAKGAVASGAAAAIGAPLAAGVAAWLGASISAAVIGGVSTGGVIGGLAAVSKHSAVKSAATALGDEFRSTMQIAAVGFVPAAVQGVGVLRSHLGAARDDLESIFDDSSRFVVPLAEGAGLAIREVLSGVRDLAEAGEPAILSIADGLVRIGDAAGDGMSMLADNADSSARALTILFGLVEYGVRGFFSLLNVLSETYELMEFGGAVLTANWKEVARLATETDRGKQANGGMAQSLDEILSGFEREEDAVRDTTRALRAYAEAADLINDQNLDVAESTLQYRDSLREAKKAADDKRGVSDAESESLLRLARQTNRLTDALEQQGASAESLAEHNRRKRASFIATAEAMGHSRTEARRLADQYLKVPREVVTEIEADTSQAARNLREVRELIGRIRSKEVVITTVLRTEGRNVPIGDGIGGRAHGGITGAASGGLRSNLTWVGESGPELVELPPSTMVHPAGTSQRMAAMAAAPAGPMVLEVHPAGHAEGRLMDALIDGLRFKIRTDGAGDPVAYLGSGG